MLEIKNLTKRYGDKIAVNNLSLTIKPGEIYAFIGHNGAGKTTTLKAVTGLIPFDEGEILIDGHSIKDEPLECKKLFSYIPDNPDLYEFMTGNEYLNFVSDVYGVDTQKREEDIKKYALEFEIFDDLNSQIKAYSHGMKQKLAIIASLLHDPRLIIMDEPFVGLDPKAAKIVKDIMKKICKDGGSIFFSTHVLEVAEKLCDKVAIIKNGQLIKSDTMKKIKGDKSLESVFLELEGE